MSWFEFLLYNWKENIQMWKKTKQLILDLVEVWLQTRHRGELEQKVVSLVDCLHQGQWFAVKRQELLRIYQVVGAKVPLRLKLVGWKTALRTTRHDIRQHWSSVWKNLTKGKFWALFTPRSLQLVLADTLLVSNFLLALIGSKKKK